MPRAPSPCCAAAASPKVQCATHEAAVAPDRVLLPAWVEPVHYDVDLTLRLNDHAFDGTTTIKVAVAAPATTVQLHAKELAVAEAKIDGVACKFTVDAETTTSSSRPRRRWRRATTSSASSTAASSTI